jgi:hypothetical protein
MQDRYFGDVGDYGKYGLLRAVAGERSGAPLRLGVVWYLTDNKIHNNDGKHVGYLAQSRFRQCDPELFDALREVANEPRRVGHVEDRGILPSSTRFYRSLLNLSAVGAAGRSSVRAEWYAGALDATAGTDVVFCDPDNGISERPEVLRSGRGAKFVGLEELAGFFRRGQSLIVYHHADRSAPVTLQAERRRGQLAAAMGTDQVHWLRFSRGTTRLYFVIPAQQHREVLASRIRELMLGPWSEHFTAASELP